MIVPFCNIYIKVIAASSLFSNPKEDWNVLYHQPITTLENQVKSGINWYIRIYRLLWYKKYPNYIKYICLVFNSKWAYFQNISKMTPKLCINHWKVLYKLRVYYVDRNSKMTTTAGHSFYIGSIGSFYNQVNDTGS
jgi:hypothetical protein